MGNLIAHAKRELQAAGYKLDGTDEPYNKMAAEAILELIEVFGKQGHSGFSAGYCISAFAALAKFEPLGPLTGDDSEWFDHGHNDSTKYQNKRCGHVFKGADGIAYDSQAVVFEEPGGCRFTGRHSRMPVTFPYTPRTAYAKVAADATDEEKKAAADLAWAA